MTEQAQSKRRGSRKIFWTAVIVGVSVVFVAGYLLGRGGAPDAAGEQASATTQAGHEHDVAEEAATIWTCSMHPQIRQPEPGLCPICGMELIPLKESDGQELGARQLQLSEAAQKLADVQTYPVERRAVTRDVRMVGKIDYDETRLEYITAWVPGRLDRLFVDYTGVPVKKGEHMVYLYSPEILTAQEELIQAAETVRNLEQSDVGIVRDTAKATVDAAREKLRLWGLTEEQINEIEASGSPSDHITIYAPASGIVVHKNAVEGMYVQTGSRIYTIADLSKLWVKLDAYESDLKWLRYGQKVSFTAEAYPGETFEGRISFIDPVLTGKTRTVKVRVNVDNADGRLKPDMFVRAQVHATLGNAQKVVSTTLAGKWICPMHPSVIEDAPGDCSICEMPLVSSESLGYVDAAEPGAELPLVVPDSAPLITGKRAVVYVKSADRKGVFEGREVQLGPKAGEFYVVESGLNAGDLVVTNGNFKIDSAMQIRAKPSMMSPDETDEPPEQAHRGAAKPGKTLDVPAAFTAQLKQVFHGYLHVHTGLVEGKADDAKTAAGKLLERLDEVDMGLLGHDAHMAWMKHLKEIRETAQQVVDAEDLTGARAVFAQLTEALIPVARKFGTGLGQPLNIMYCPMAFNNRGADWMQLGEDLENPYYGDAMLRCGEIKGTLGATDK